MFEARNREFLWIRFQFLEDADRTLSVIKRSSQTVDGGESGIMTEEKWKLKDRQALGLIWFTLSRNFAFNIVKDKTASDLLKALSNMYEKTSAMNKKFDA